MNTAYFLINTVFDLYLMVILLRVWLQWARADFYNPMSQMVVKLTNPLVIPLRRVIPGFGGIDLASVVLALAIAFAKLALLKSMNVLLADWLSISLFAALTVLKKSRLDDLLGTADPRHPELGQPGPQPHRIRDASVDRAVPRPYPPRTAGTGRTGSLGAGRLYRPASHQLPAG